MNKLIFSIFGVVGSLLCIGCEQDKDIDSLVATESSVQTTSHLRTLSINNPESLSENELAYKFARFIRQQIIQNDKVLPLIQEATSKKIDGDYNFLVSSLTRESSIPSSRSTNNKSLQMLFSSFDGKDLVDTQQGLLDSIAEFKPLLNIYMPDWGDLSQYDDFLIAVLPKGANGQKGYKLDAYNKKGDLIILDSKKEPNIPYMVIGYNERVNLSPNTGERSSSILQTKYYTYELKTTYIPTTIASESYNTLADENRVAPKVRKRSIFDGKNYEVIKMARFLSRDALRNVEEWTRGNPEMFCKVYYKKLGSFFDFAVGHVSIHDINLGEDDWYTGSQTWIGGNDWKVVDNYGNWRVFRWAPTALMTKIAYAFYEDDEGARVRASFSGREISVTVENGEYVGSDWVFFQDPLGKTYKLSNSFEFVIDQEK